MIHIAYKVTLSKRLKTALPAAGQGATPLGTEGCLWEQTNRSSRAPENVILRPGTHGQRPLQVAACLSLRPCARRPVPELTLDIRLDTFC